MCFFQGVGKLSGNYSKTHGKHVLDARLRGHDELGKTCQSKSFPRRGGSREQGNFHIVPGLFEQIRFLGVSWFCNLC